MQNSKHMQMELPVISVHLNVIDQKIGQVFRSYCILERKWAQLDIRSYCILERKWAQPDSG